MLAPPKNLPFARFYWYLQCFQYVAQDKFDSVFWAILRKSELTGAERTLVESSTIFLGICSVLTDPSIYFRIDT